MSSSSCTTNSEMRAAVGNSGRGSNCSFSVRTLRSVSSAGYLPTRTWENCREASERKSGTHSYDDLVDRLSELAMERELDSHMDKYLRKHLQRETPAEKAPGGRSPQRHSNPGKGPGAQLKHMTETPPSKDKGAPNLFYCRHTEDKDPARRPTVMGKVSACSN